MTIKAKWIMPKWMEPYRVCLSDGRRAEELMSGRRATVFENAPLALIQMGMEAEIELLLKLNEKGLLRRGGLTAEQLDLALAGERRDCSKALLALAGWFPTPGEGYGFNTSWAISDLCRAIEQLRRPVSAA